MVLLALSLVGVASAAIPALMLLHNRTLFRPPSDPAKAASDRPVELSVLIPARNEADGIVAAVESALASEGVTVEVVVLDDQSTDATASRVTELASRGDRLRLISGQPLPAGWNGKQFACWLAAQQARYRTLVFIDADVRLAPDALRRLAAYRQRHGVALLSAFPHQQTGTWLEAWLIPLMHYVLLGFLPIGRMRGSTAVAYAAGCGQLFVTTRDDYRRAGTHQAIRATRHDGLKLPAVYRAAGLSTDVVDGTPIASCRMYRGGGEVIRGLLKNASEGIASPQLIVPFSSILLGANLLPWLTLAGSLGVANWPALAGSLAALLLAHLPRTIAAVQFRQPWMGVVCHTPAVVVFVTLQWLALAMDLAGIRLAWRGRR